MKKFLFFIVVICCFMMSCIKMSSVKYAEVNDGVVFRSFKLKIKDNLYVKYISPNFNGNIYYLVDDKDSIISNIVIDGGELNIKETK